MNTKFNTRRGLLACTAMASTFFGVNAAYAQSANADNGGLEEIIVTAQKREQSLQDVPIAVTAVTEDSLKANRILNVNDLASVAPGLTVRPSPGGINTPFITIRGQQSQGVVAGSDKQVSIYLDGVYLASPRGSIFDLPDVARLEVLRGPQGTLFGRNATGGAISVVTRDPSGKFGGTIEGSYGNQDAYRIRATVETPEFGPFSAYFSYVRNYRRGDIRNLAEGVVWDRTSVNYGKVTSPRWLGTTDTNSYFAAVKFESGDFKTVYKFDQSDDKGTPDAVAVVAPGAGLKPFLVASGVPFASDGLRPDTVSNSWTTARQQKSFGHSLTSTWRASDAITVKNILAYRKTTVFAPTAIDGFGGIVLSAANAPFLGIPAAGIPSVVGKRFIGFVSQSVGNASQWSDELQVNYSSDKLQATAGVIWFSGKEESGGPPFMPNSPNGAIGFLPADGTIPSILEGRSFNWQKSLAGYVQLEYKVTPNVELVGGVRVTNDKKRMDFRFDIPALSIPTTLLSYPKYSLTKAAYLAGINWRPANDTLLYFKYSNSYVSGGNSYNINYQPEVASSFELGAKIDFFDKRLRTNLALYNVNYKHYQSANSPRASAASLAICLDRLVTAYGTALGNGLCTGGPISTFVFDFGDIRSRGFELEVSAAPARGVTLGVSLGYSDNKFTRIDPIITAASGGDYLLTNRPAWTGAVYGSVETKPIIGNMTAALRLDGLYQSRNQIATQPAAFFALANPVGSDPAYAVPAYWIFNGRAALKHIAIAGTELELSVWGKNLTDRKYISYGIGLGPSLATTASFMQARSFGVEAGIKF